MFSPFFLKGKRKHGPPGDKERIPPPATVPTTGPRLHPVALFHLKISGEYLIVRAANMKRTVEKATGNIINVSGGGCPDVPCLVPVHEIRQSISYVINRKIPIRSSTFDSLECHHLIKKSALLY